MHHQVQYVIGLALCALGRYVCVCVCVCVCVYTCFNTDSSVNLESFLVCVKILMCVCMQPNGCYCF